MLVVILFAMVMEKQKLLFTALILVVLLLKCEGRNLRLVGGDIVYSSDFAPYYASLQNLLEKHVCGGAVISNRHVVTAAHCVLGTLPKYIIMQVGTTNLDENGKKYNVNEIDIHEDYQPLEKLNDIAILISKKEFEWNIVSIIPISSKQAAENEWVMLPSFGAFESKGNSVRKMHVLNTIVFKQTTCKYAMRYTRNVTDTMFCTFTTIGEGTCHGDSGGPLVRNDELVGIVSWGIPCATGFPDVHTRITPYIEWIQEKIK